MPKQVDHEKRRRQIAEATWRLISTEGIEQATVRKIAQEAGLSLGALRHYFATQDELLRFSMELSRNGRNNGLPPSSNKEVRRSKSCSMFYWKCCRTKKNTSSK